MEVHLLNEMVKVACYIQYTFSYVEYNLLISSLYPLHPLNNFVLSWI